MAQIHVDVVIAAPTPEPETEAADAAAIEDSAPTDGAAGDAEAAEPNRTRGKREKEEDQ